MKSDTNRSASSSRPRRRRRSAVRPPEAAHRRPTNGGRPSPPVRGLAFEPVDIDQDPVEFASLELDAALQLGVQDRGYVRTTPVQNAVFPIVRAGDDLIASAETGTGKTAAFLLPLMHRLIQGATEPGHTRVLVLAPTRELAVQIEDDFQGFAYHTALTGMAVYGGVAMDPQERALRAGVDLVVATPGRLLDHMRGDAPAFARLEALVLDEADRMLDMGFWPDVRRIVAELPASGAALSGHRRQTLLFSATMPEEVMRLASEILHEAKYVQIGARGRPARTITHTAHVVATPQKTEWLARFLRGAPGSALVFVRTKRGADVLSRRLGALGIRTVAFHADRLQAHRTAAVEGFRSGRFKVLVATDIAARGLDIEGIEHVVNFEVPTSKDAYVHRVGRTGRADAEGHALTLVAPEERRALRVLEESFDLRLA